MTDILERFSQFTDTTAVYPAAKTGDIMEVMYLGLGLGDETGEVLGKIKKLFRDHNVSSVEDIPLHAMQALSKELGDVMWYWARLARVLMLEPAGIIATNMEKLELRKAANTLHGEGDDR